VKRKFTLSILALSFLSLVVLYNNCSQDGLLGGKGFETNTGNPMVSNALLTGMCSVINRCNTQVELSDCKTGILNTSGFNTVLGLSSNYSVFSSIVQAEQGGSLVANQTAGNSCYNNVNALTCSDPRVVGAYVPSQANPYSGAPNMLPPTSCDQAYSAQALPQLVQNAATFVNATNLTVTISISSTGSGNLLIAGIAGGSASQVTTISDNAPGGSNTWVNTNYQCTDTQTPREGWLWYAKNSSPGATSVTVNWTGADAGTMNFWVAEFSGMDTLNPLDVGAVANSQAANTVASAPGVNTTAPYEIVFSIVATYIASGLNAGSSFTAFPFVRGDNLAYQITTSTGSYGAQWTQSSADYCASTISFKAAQQ